MYLVTWEDKHRDPVHIVLAYRLEAVVLVKEIAVQENANYGHPPIYMNDPDEKPSQGVVAATYTVEELKDVTKRVFDNPAQKSFSVTFAEDGGTVWMEEIREISLAEARARWVN